MRKWHRWLSVLFGAFLLWISVTGVLSNVVPWFLPRPDPAVAAAATPAGFVCPETLMCRPKSTGTSIIGTLHHLHGGESFGPLGIAISIMSGLALVFFSFSGLWLYIQMWRHRAGRKQKPGWFWK